MRGGTVRLLTGVLVLVAVSALVMSDASPPAAVPGKGTACGPEQGVCRDRLLLASGWTIPVYRNFPITGSDAVTDAVVVVHGDLRDPVATYVGMLKAATAAGASGHTIIIAPYFQTAADRPGPKDARWRSSGWKDGDGAVRPKGESSFEVMDEIMHRLADRSRFPDLGHITLIGHSAGAQFTQRYAAAGQAPAALNGVPIDFVVANPSSYLYLEPARPDPTDRTGTRFVVPRTNCPYDDYKYGLRNRNRYLSQLSDAQIIANYTSRHVTYLQGDADTRQDSLLDTSCAARLQGKNRFQRGTLYFNRIKARYPTAPHTRFVVHAVAHDHDAMFASLAARPILFGATSTP
jgi:pimeloyl-ACP methyl ester carboxylesterase